MSFLKSLKTVVGDKFGTVADVGAVGDLAGWIDTGSYSMNALLSGSIYGGLPSNKISAFAGESGVGKTYFQLQVAAGFLALDPANEVVMCDSEAAITSEMIVGHGLDANRTAIIPVATIEEFRTLAVRILEKYEEQHAKEGFKVPRLMIILDSFGNLSTIKETTGMSEGSDKRDMTKAQLNRGAFRVLTIKCGMLNVPMILTNHTYASVGGNYPMQVQSGGGGLIYAASTILMLTKSKQKDDTGVIGSIIKVKTDKARFTKEQQSVYTLLNFDRGLDRYWGLLEMAEEAGIFVKVSTKYQLPDGSKVFESKIRREPERYFTRDVLDRIDAWAKTRYPYQAGEIKAITDEELEDVEGTGVPAGT